MKYSTPIKSDFIIGFIAILVLGIFALAHPHKGLAISSSDFQAGHIIDDVIFLNHTSMSAQDIQNFLNAKVPSCDTNGTQASEFGGGTRAQYGTSKGYPPPYTCLKDYSTSVPSMPADSYCSAIPASGSLSAASIIKEVSDACLINPQVMVVLLQKEQGLVTDTWPWSVQYKFATGYCVYDTTPPPSCSGTDGFFNQIYYGARQFKKYLANNGAPGVFWIGNYRIPYNPDSSCGSSIVNIENGATAALYDYTPYQPNDAALAGVSDSSAGGTVTCGAYGNRNFWWYFNEWFGNSLATKGSAQPVWQSIYTNNSENHSLGWNANLVPGQDAWAVVLMKNTGNSTWTKDGGNFDVRLATYPWGRISSFCAGRWIVTSPNCTRPSALIGDTNGGSTVAPGDTGVFKFPINAPTGIGTYNEQFGLVVDGQTTFNSGFINIQFNVQHPVYSAQPAWQGVYTSSAKSGSPTWNYSFTPGQNAWAVVVMKNTSNFTWTKGGLYDVRLATYGGWGRISPFCAGLWIKTSPNCTRPATFNEASVDPGQNATFEFNLNAPTGINAYNESFGLVSDGKSTFSSGFMNIQLTVNP